MQTKTTITIQISEITGNIPIITEDAMSISLTADRDDYSTTVASLIANRIVPLFDQVLDRHYKAKSVTKPVAPPAAAPDKPTAPPAAAPDKPTAPPAAAPDKPAAAPAPVPAAADAGTADPRT